MATKTEESSVTEERIAHILHEASAALRAQQVDDSGSDESKPPSQTQVTHRPPLDCLALKIANERERKRKETNKPTKQHQQGNQNDFGQ